METMEKNGRSGAAAFFYTVMLVVGIGLIVRHDLTAARAGIRIEPNLAELQDVFTGNFSPSLIADPLPHYLGSMESGREEVHAAAVATAAVPPMVKGYVDQINCLVVVDSRGSIRAVRVIDNRETPAYMRRVEDAGFLDRLVGRNLKHGLEGIDTVTGASITARAILDDVGAAGAMVSNKVFGLDVPQPELPSWKKSTAEPRFLAVAAALIAALYGRFGKWPKRWRREAAWVVSIILIGIYAMTPYTLVHTFQVLETNLPGPGNAILAALLGFVVVTTILFGPVWCAYACPFGALQELLSKLPVRRWKVTPRLMLHARRLRYLVLFSCTVGVFGLGMDAFAEVEPFGHLFSRNASTAAWIFIIAVLGTSLFVKRFWCRFLCPTGACLVMLSYHRRFFRSIGRGVDEAGIDRADLEAETMEPGKEQ